MVYIITENQVMSDAEQEDIPDDVQHIPPPPTRYDNSCTLNII